MNYFAPDALEWEEMQFGYSGFLRWCLDGDLDLFYKGFRWAGWEREVAALPGDQGFMIYPFLAAEGPTIEERLAAAMRAKRSGGYAGSRGT